MIAQNSPDRGIAKRAQRCAEFQLLAAQIQLPFPQETFFSTSRIILPDGPRFAKKQNDRVYVCEEDSHGEAGNLLLVKEKQREIGAGRVRGRWQRCLYR